MYNLVHFIKMQYSSDIRSECLWNQVKPRRVKENVKYAPSYFSFENILNVWWKLLDFKHYKQTSYFLNIIMLDNVLSKGRNFFARLALKCHIGKTLLLAFCRGVKLAKVWENTMVCKDLTCLLFFLMDSVIFFVLLGLVICPTLRHLAITHVLLSTNYVIVVPRLLSLFSCSMIWDQLALAPLFPIFV